MQTRLTSRIRPAFIMAVGIIFLAISLCYICSSYAISESTLDPTPRTNYAGDQMVYLWDDGVNYNVVGWWHDGLRWNVQNIVTCPSVKSCPAISGDGRTAFWRTETANDLFWSTFTSGTGWSAPNRITTTDWDYAPSLSGDGSVLAYHGGPGYPTPTEVLVRRGPPYAILPENVSNYAGGDDFYPSVSQSGNQVAFVRDYDKVMFSEYASAWSAPFDITGALRLGGGWISSPLSISGLGDRVAFDYYPSGEMHVYVAERVGGTWAKIFESTPPSGIDDMRPSISRDGLTLAYETHYATSDTIMAVRNAFGTPFPVTNMPAAFFYRPSVNEDGTTIFFDDGSNVYIWGYGGLTFSVGPNTSSSNFVPAGSPDVPMFQLHIVGYPTESVTIKKITFRASGTGDDSPAGVAQVRVYLDENHNGQVDSTEPLIYSGAFSGDNGTLTIIPLADTGTIPMHTGPVDEVDWLVVYDFSSSASGTYGVGVSDVDLLPENTVYFEATGDTAGQQIKPFGVPVNGNARSVSSTGTFQMNFTGGRDVTAYAMRSLPLMPPQPDLFLNLQSWLGLYAPSSWRAFAYISGGYIEVNAPGIFNIEYGNGWWLIVANTAVVQAAGTLAPATDYYLHVDTGWNIISNPFTITVNWADVVNSPFNTGKFGPLLIRDIIWEYNHGVYQMAGQMVPGFAYWLQNQGPPQILTIPHPGILKVTAPGMKVKKGLWPSGVPIKKYDTPPPPPQ